MIPAIAGLIFPRPRLPSRRRICIGLLILLLTLVSVWTVGFIRELFEFWREVAYFEELHRISDLDATWESLSRMGLSEIAEKPPPWNDRLIPLFPDVVQLRSWTWAKQLRLYPDGTAEYPMEHVWIYLAGNKTCPKGDGIALCEDYVDAFDRVIQYHHVKRPAAGAFLSFVDCDLSSICDEWGAEANIIVNLQTMSPCTSHLPTDDDPEFRFICSAAFRFIGLPLSKTPTRSLERFPSAYEQLLSLTTNDGFIDAIEPLDFEDTVKPGLQMTLASEEVLQQASPDSRFPHILKAFFSKYSEVVVGAEPSLSA
jgi:hypothetical protein